MKKTRLTFLLLCMVFSILFSFSNNSMRKYKYYSLTASSRGNAGYFKTNVPFPLFQIGDDVSNWQIPELELTDGKYAPFIWGLGGVIYLSTKCRDALLNLIPEDYPVAFLPVNIKSEKYGNRQYYALYYKTVFDVIDKERSKKADDAITVPAFVFEKVKDLPFFPQGDYQFSIVLSKKVYKSLKRKGLLKNTAVYVQYAYE